MAVVEQTETIADVEHPCSRMERQIRDYFAAIHTLIWQRQAIFFSSVGLTLFYFDPIKSLACYGAVLLTEVADLMMTRKVNRHDIITERQARKYVRWILINTILSAGTICLFVYMIALQQPIGSGHFTPLFFLFAAALFAAMNNHQIFSVLAVRLSMYGTTFLAIALMDIVRVNPPLSSELWLQFFTVVFAMYFIIDCSFVFLRLYRKNVRQIEDLREEHERTKIAYKAKSQFVAVVSHELRTPLTSIKGSLDLINSGVLGQIPENMKSVMTIAGKNSTRLADLINDVLDLQKIEAGEVAYRFAPLNVRELVLDAVDANTGMADSMNIQLVADIAGKDDLWVRGDEKRLMQVMCNMVSNALKFSYENGTVSITYGRIGNRVRVAVEDQGVGIPDDAKETVFGKFTQIDSTDQREVGGTGLGMNISRQIVEQHNGTIDYVSEQGVGTTFYFDLAILDQQEAA